MGASNPLAIVAVIVELLDFVQAIASEAGDALRLKLPPLGGPLLVVTVKVTVVVCVIPPPIPVTVMGYEPVETEPPTAIVIVEFPEPGFGIGLGLKDTVTPAGWPEADNVTAELNAPVRALVIVDVPLEPWPTDTVLGEGERVNVGPVTTVKVTVAVLIISPPVPVTVIG